MANPSQVFLLADHVKLSLLERQRATTLNLDSHTQDGNISRSLESMRDGIEAIEEEASRLQAANDPLTSKTQEQARNLRSQYSKLYSQYVGSSITSSNTLSSPNNLSLSADFVAASTIPNKAPHSSIRRSTQSPAPTPKSVRFRDNPLADDSTHQANRAELFPYRDDPANTQSEQNDLSNHQIHACHAQVLREQDDHLDRLGESIGRQRDLSIRIGDELEEQIGMLDDVENHVDRHQGRLDGARDRIGRIARKANDNKQITTIVVLIVILILLIIVFKT